MLIGIVLQGAEYWSLRRADTNLGNRLATTCQQVVGTNRTSAMRDPSLRIDALTYRNKITNVQLIASDVGAIDKFARDLEQTHRFASKIESANQNNNGIEGRLQIAPK